MSDYILERDRQLIERRAKHQRSMHYAKQLVGKLDRPVKYEPDEHALGLDVDIEAWRRRRA